MADKWAKIRVKCSDCDGSGRRYMTAGDTECGTCEGSGEVEAGKVKVDSITDKLDEILAKLNEP